MHISRVESPDRQKARPQKISGKLTVGIFCLFLSVYLLVTSARLSSVDDKIMFDVARSILANGSFSASEPLSERDYFVEPWFYVTGKDGKAYGKYGPGESLAMLPLFALGKTALPAIPASHVDWFPPDYIPFKLPERISEVERTEDTVIPAFISLLNPMATAATCLIVFLITYYLGHSVLSSLSVAGIFGFATAAFPYAKYSFQHPLVTALILLTFYGLFSWQTRGQSWRLVVAGIALGLGSLVRYESIVSLAVFAPYLCWGAYWRAREAGPRPSSSSETSLATARAPAEVRSAGEPSPHPLPFAKGRGSPPPIPCEEIDTLPHPSLAEVGEGVNTLNHYPSTEGGEGRGTLSYRNGRGQGEGSWGRGRRLYHDHQLNRLLAPLMLFVIPVLLFELVVLWFNYVRFGSLWDTGYFQEGFTSDLGIGLKGLVLSPGRSLFLFSPPAALGLLCLPWFLRKRFAEGAVLASTISIYFALYAKWSGWEGGWAWGARYPLPLLPFLVLPIVVALEARRFWPKALVFGLAALSLPIQLLGVATNFNEFYMERTLPGDTDFWLTVYNWDLSQIPGHLDLLKRGIVDLWLLRLLSDGAPLELRAIVLIPLGLLLASGLLIRGGLRETGQEVGPGVESGKSEAVIRCE